MGVYPDKVIRCPGCGGLSRLPVVSFSGSEDLKRWIDGYVQHPLVAEPPLFTQCCACGSFFWISDAPVMGSFSFRRGIRIPGEWEELLYVRDLNYQEILLALESGAASGKPVGFEIYLRILSLQKYNHKRRQEVFCREAAAFSEKDGFREEPAVFPSDMEKNMESLCGLLCMDKGLEYGDSREFFSLTYGEVLRELSRWQESVKVLESVRPGWGILGKSIYSLASRKIGGIYRLEEAVD